MIFLNKYPSIKLDSGIRIVNYSSPHTYKFHTGEELPACSDEVAQDTKLEANHGREKTDKGWYDISIYYSLTYMQKKELKALSALNEIDIILVPYPVASALKELLINLYIQEEQTALDHDEDDDYSKLKRAQWDKIRVCKLHDRVTKVIRSDEFCV